MYVDLLSELKEAKTRIDELVESYSDLLDWDIFAYRVEQYRKALDEYIAQESEYVGEDSEDAVNALKGNPDKRRELFRIIGAHVGATHDIFGRIDYNIEQIVFTLKKRTNWKCRQEYIDYHDHFVDFYIRFYRIYNDVLQMNVDRGDDQFFAPKDDVHVKYSDKVK